MMDLSGFALAAMPLDQSASYLSGPALVIMNIQSPILGNANCLEAIFTVMKLQCSSKILRICCGQATPCS